MTVDKSEVRCDSFLTGNGRRVLVVDDEPDTRRVVRIVLEKAGYDVLEADDGETAIEVVNTGENRLMLDAVICDIGMPKIDGLFTVAYLRNQFPHVPVVILTGVPDTEMAVTCLCEGAVDYLLKPVDGERLRAAVSHAMGQRDLPNQERTR